MMSQVNKKFKGTLPFDMFILDSTEIKEATCSAIVQALLFNRPSFLEEAYSALNDEMNKDEPILSMEDGIVFTVLDI